MAKKAVALAGPAHFANAAATLYTAPSATTTILRRLHVQNPDASAHTFTLSKGADASGTRLYDAFSVAAGTALDVWLYEVIIAANVIQGWDDGTAKLVYTLNGDELSAG